MNDASPLVIAAIAFALVFATLSVLALALFGLRILARRSDFSAHFAAGEDHQRPQEIEPEILVVLAAAAHEALGAPVRIHRVHVHHGRTAGDAWSRSGRMDIMISHRVDRKR
jgi:Na+-transporting methylmalonyl-CoA/oxaloacetate decarboxylase gamma subunit